MPSGCVLGTMREEANHHSPLSGGHTPGTMLSPKVLMPSEPPASALIQPRDSANSNSARRLPQSGASSVANADPAADRAALTWAARARFQPSEASPTVASAGIVAAARL